MTQAILPLNVSALRVNENDASNLTARFKGRTALFEGMPYTPSSRIPSTGAAIMQALHSSRTPAANLKAGVHLHWELPDVYKRGVQGPKGGAPIFPHAPNTWLVIRYLQIFDAGRGTYGDTHSKGFIVESDYLSATPPVDSSGTRRPAVSVPLPQNPGAGKAPYRYMGRVVDYESWTGPDGPSNYLSAYAPHYLSSIGFVGPSFASYYPECHSVFGFWDTFKDNPGVSRSIEGNIAIKFRVSYQVIGWVRDAAKDVFADFPQTVTRTYNQHVARANAENADITVTPRDEIARIARRELKLAFDTELIDYTLNPDKTIKTLDAPARGLCAGVAQSIVWDMSASPGTRYFLNNPQGPQPNAIWTDKRLKLAVGNTAIEGLAALLKREATGPQATAAQQTGMEILLDALQLGLLNDIETKGSSLIALDEALHSRAFTKVAGGYLWSIEPREPPQKAAQRAPATASPLPLDLAEELNALNVAQKAYDQGRGELDALRRQLFMDWQRWIAEYIDPRSGSLHIAQETLTRFLDNQSPECELGYVVARGKAIGLQRYDIDPATGAIAALAAPSDTASLAGAAYSAWQALKDTLKAHPQWMLIAAPAPNFWLPAEPVLVMESQYLQAPRRNGAAAITPARLPSELLSQLIMSYGGGHFTLPVAQIPGRLELSAATPMRDQVAACAGESFLLVPMLAGRVAEAVAALPGDNPAKADPAAFVQTLNTAQGGASALDPQPADGGLYARLHEDGAMPIKNPVQQVAAPLKIAFTFTNPAASGCSPYAPALTAQAVWPGFGAERVDPFLPLFLIWNSSLDPLARDAEQNYRATSLTAHFELDADEVDYTYPLAGDAGHFTSAVPVRYAGSALLSRQPTKSLIAQIDRYTQTHPNDPANSALAAARTAYANAPIAAQGLGGFNGLQLLRDVIARVPVENRTQGPRDALTAAIAAAATAAAQDKWYDFGFNTLQPIPHGMMASNNFGPVRAGFMQIFDLEIVDVFGQRMNLVSADPHPNGAQNAIPSFSLAPAKGDTKHARCLYLPPRLLAPSRLWLRWLSAEHDTKVKGCGEDFVEMNTHPATSPVCGFAVPNHLDNSLFFYRATGRAIGSFGIEHGALVYRSRPGGADDLAADIGPRGGAPRVNAHLYDFMWRIERGGADFLIGMMQAILGSEGFLNPAKYAEEVSLSVLIGQPLAIARAVVGLESQGGVAPLNQSDTSADAPFSKDVSTGLYKYPERQAASSAKLETIEIPLRLGNLAHIDDGMIGFFIDGNEAKEPYGVFYAPAARRGAGGVAPPTAQTLTVTLNQKPRSVTLLMDPRAPIHATSGILPVAELSIPPDQYVPAMSQLEMTFFTHPVLQGADGLKVPLPLESGYEWSWVQPGFTDPIPLAARAGSEVAKFGYTPQTLLEGYTELSPAPPPETPPKEGEPDE